LGATEGNLLDVICGQVGGRVGRYAVSGAPVTVFGAVRIDDAFASCTVAGFTCLGSELPLVSVVGASVLGAA
jgi:hypothetical protein